MPTHLERIRAEVVGIVSKDPLGNLQADRCIALLAILGAGLKRGWAQPGGQPHAAFLAVLPVRFLLLSSPLFGRWLVTAALVCVSGPLQGSVGEGCVRVVCQDSRMPRHIESMRDEVQRHAKASFFMLHNLAADRCLSLYPWVAAKQPCRHVPTVCDSSLGILLRAGKLL